VLALNRLSAVRIAATAKALDALKPGAQHVLLRIAPDEAIVLARTSDAPMPLPFVDDPHAIIVAEGGYAGIWVPQQLAHALLARHCEWPLPEITPAFAQGAIANIATKLWFEDEQVLFVIPAPLQQDFEERVR
jgi:hypothetical protein